jgi:hypothetical protein
VRQSTVSTPLEIALFAPVNSQYRESIEKLDPTWNIRDMSRTGSIAEADLAIFLIHADRGLSPEDISTFHQIRELQLPTLILVASLAPELAPEFVPGSDARDQWDFDDVVMLVNRVLEQAVTPFLVLHGEDGAPSGLFDLGRNVVIDYSLGDRREDSPDADLIGLTEDFRNEYQESGFTGQDFFSGLTVLALPFIPERGIGVFEIRELLTKLQLAQPSHH